MLTQFNCHSATYVKNTNVFYYIHDILHTHFKVSHVCMWAYFVHFCYAKAALPELFEEPYQPVLNFLRNLLHCSFQGK